MGTAKNPPAFPLESPTTFPHQPGMDLRDWFARQALTGLLANPGSGRAEDWAKAAYVLADAMLVVRASAGGR